MPQLGLRLIDSNVPVLGFAISALLRLCRTASRWLRSLAPVGRRCGLRLCRSIPVASHPDAENVIETREHADDFKEP